MSSLKFQQPVYKVYEPGYHPQRTIIVDEQIDSPETLTIRLEEEAAARNGGDLDGNSPNGLLPMAAYKTHLQGQYLPQTSSNITVLSCHPGTGTYGTKVALRVSSQYDILSGTMAASTPYVSISFGSQRCPAHVQRGSPDANGSCIYVVTADAPEFLSTGCPSLGNVPLSLLVETANGSEIARVPNAGMFSYSDGQGGVGSIGGSGAGSPPDLGSPKDRSPSHRASPPTHHGLEGDSATTTYGFPPGVSPTQAQTYGHNTNSMLGAYRSGSFSEHYSRTGPVLRSPHGSGWGFGGHMESIRSPATTIPHTSHTGLTRTSLSSISSSSSAPTLTRTSTIPQQGGSGGHGGNGYGYPLYQNKATLNIVGDLGSMAENWTQEEFENKRRIVIFDKSQHGAVLTTRFKPVNVTERPSGAICISCIWWAEKQECYVTSVDTIHLLEQLVAAPNRFSVEERNRIRRNLEGFRPLTVSKQKPDSEEFFKVIMQFGNPKPRNIEKDIKVFAWKILDQALKKIISKYSTSPSALSIPAAPSATGPLYGLPPTPSTVSSTDQSSTGYMGASHHLADSLASPRPLGGASSWTPYGTSGRPMSPSRQTSSPMSVPGLRISTLSGVYDNRGSTQSLSSPYGMTSSTQHSPHSHHAHGNYVQSGVSVSQGPRAWDSSYGVTDSYGAAQTSHTHSQVYGGGAYADVHRA
ncbi:hypothetical protein NEUTE1DRAFT_120630 [Neurospora tetrasperma FGSC 2508]|uniref:DUF7082 domain-containing protein n=1 Tax=Neurospora tetrasperma (strain FGSC 2508 / ATCC MYA-4615 / P0657) TaxID=510951 RepID=F8MGB9_NEUT8|nr:uncharacterized protein NEUTE1DRAFT_120630 [Neurospora tetrasperma FGSC 2508]EGO58594.1 hypothetical protein NEUTE1DRAFT_120630 [Neurospora tetrasperma FGSC 2508]EGZ72667.1 hypothetical protein NEUTE2DRAFT_156378 [Neurospora tetrasperma FGSC 2509]